MTISRDSQPQRLTEVGRIVANALVEMTATAQPGMTTCELDDVGRRNLDRHGARGRLRG